jgi:GNAT superfamily N-acetyltransferase
VQKPVSPALVAQLLRRVPDDPSWIEARGLLLSGRGHVLALPDDAAIVWSAEDRIAVLVGLCRPLALAEAMTRISACHTLIVQAVQQNLLRAAMPGWTCEPATIHTLPATAALRSAPMAGETRLLGAADANALSLVPASLEQELRHALRRSPIAVTMADGQPVSFAYAFQTTERWFDISIDTLEPYRRQGLAQAAVGRLIREMATRGLSPVWGAVESNVPSARLAARLGFRPVGRIAVATRPGP